MGGSTSQISRVSWPLCRGININLPNAMKWLKLNLEVMHLVEKHVSPTPRWWSFSPCHSIQSGTILRVVCPRLWGGQKECQLLRGEWLYKIASFWELNRSSAFLDVLYVVDLNLEEFTLKISECSNQIKCLPMLLKIHLNFGTQMHASHKYCYCNVYIQWSHSSKIIYIASSLALSSFEVPIVSIDMHLK